MAVIAAQDQQIRRLTEEKSEMQEKPEQSLSQSEKTAATTRPAGQDSGLQGLVSAVDIPNALAEISIGMADGVKTEMTFRVMRGDKFVCNILVVDVDEKKAVGDIQSVQLPPRVGDKVSANLKF